MRLEQGTPASQQSDTLSPGTVCTLSVGSLSPTQKAKVAFPRLLGYHPDSSHLQETEIQFELTYYELGSWVAKVLGLSPRAQKKKGVFRKLM